jgi:hypothetical protein
MRFNPIQAAFATIVILTTAVLAEVLAPRELLARSSATLNLEQVIPQKFGEWSFNPNVGLITPSEPPDFVEPDANSAPIYAKELARGYTNPDGNLVMLLVAYGPVQNHRLKAHRLRTGNEIATGIVEQQIIRLKYGLRGIIPDGAVIRVSTIGISADASFKLQDQFIRELLAAVSPETRKFLIGNE